MTSLNANSPTSAKPVVHNYRNVQYKYNAPQSPFKIGSSLCDCQCRRSSCSDIDLMMLYGYDVTHAEKLYQQTPEYKNENTEKNKKTETPHMFLPYNARDSQPCVVCYGIRHAFYSLLNATHTDFKKEAIDPQVLAAEPFESLFQGVEKYELSKKEDNDAIASAIKRLELKRVNFQEQSQKIQALKNKIRVGQELLHAAADKLRNMGESFNTLRQQNGLQYEDRVPVGIPYLPPFFTLSNRNYVIMMVCINLLMLIGILVYAFIGRIQTDADIVQLRPQPTSSNTPATAASSTSQTTDTAELSSRSTSGSAKKSDSVRQTNADANATDAEESISMPEDSSSNESTSEESEVSNKEQGGTRSRKNISRYRRSHRLSPQSNVYDM